MATRKVIITSQHVKIAEIEVPIFYTIKDIQNFDWQKVGYEGPDDAIVEFVNKGIVAELRRRAYNKGVI